MVVVTVFDFGDSQQALYVTAIGEQKTITLADNSVVQLNTNSRLSVDYNDKLRGIHLIEGEAHFQVAHNPDLPFEVYTGTGVVRAVGTSFSVYIKHKQVEVVVDQGIVEIDTMPAPALPNKTEAAQTTLPVSSAVLVVWNLAALSLVILKRYLRVSPHVFMRVPRLPLSITSPCSCH